LTREFLARADNELARITKITKQSLAFHRDSQNPIPVEVNSVVADVISVLERSVAARHVHLVCSATMPVTVCGYPGQLRQVFVNLIRNAAEAAFPDTDVVIRIRSVHRRGMEGALITIHDRGSGIPESIRDKLFDPFFTTKELKGSGLGLWVSKIVILHHNGTIRFRTSDRAGKSGTTFEVFLGGTKPNQDLALESK
jgi:signal transduction histidine kinase